MHGHLSLGQGKGRVHAEFLLQSLAEKGRKRLDGWSLTFDSDDDDDDDENDEQLVSWVNQKLSHTEIQNHIILLTPMFLQKI